MTAQDKISKGMRNPLIEKEIKEFRKKRAVGYIANNNEFESFLRASLTRTVAAQIEKDAKIAEGQGCECEDKNCLYDKATIIIAKAIRNQNLL